MRDRLTIVFGLLILLPVILLAVLGAKIAQDEQTMVAERLESLREDRLAAIATDIRRTVELAEAELGASLALRDTDDEIIPSQAVKQAARPTEGSSTERLRDLARTHPLIRQVFVVGSDGALEFPRAEDATEAERSFLARTEAIWRGKAMLADVQIPERGDRGFSRGSSLNALASRRPRGWVTWYWEEGLHLLHWLAREEGGVIGVEVDRVALIARIVGVLPELEVEDGRVVLLDLRGESVYQWGQGEPKKGERPRAKRALDHPLESYALVDLPGEGGVLVESTQLGFWASLAAALSVVFGLAVYFHRERTREAREARQKVNFVTQVSHELKTPLTNIRMYAELLADDVEALEDQGPKRHLDVIVGESQRLSRLIHNILTFSRHQSDRLTLRAVDTPLRPLVDAVMAQFAPSFAAKQIDVRIEGEVSARVDPDAIEQILGNLVSNVEKYAASGKRLDVALSEDTEGPKLVVRDHGPGVPKDDLRRIFEPFFRLGDRLSDGVTGTGIGLTIAGELARLMGGSLDVERAEPGLRFTLRLPRVST